MTLTCNALLEENARRKARVLAVYDPVQHPSELDDDTRARQDFAYWAATRARIKNKRGGDDIPFRLNYAQTKLVAALDDMRLAGKPIRLILLKARQWGGSTCVQLYMAWMQLTQRTGLNSLIIAHQATATDEIKDMFDRLILGLTDAKAEHRQDLHIRNVGRSRSIFRIEERNAKVKVGTAERPDSCRGGDYSLVHCSEVGIWKSTLGKTPEQILRSACSGVLLEPMTMIVYESTANGTGNFFHSEYEAAKSGESQFSPLFIPWFDIPQYMLPLDDAGEFCEWLIANKDAEASTSNRRQPGAYLWWLWQKGATLEGINWYISERSKYGDHALMAAEYPSDDIEAFVHSGAKVFDRYKVEALREATRPAPMTGEIDIPATNGIPFDYAHADTDTLARYLPSARFMERTGGSWRVWAVPEENVRYEDRYLVCVDVGGRSAKADWSVIAVFDRKPMTEGGAPEVVAQWRGHTDFDLLAWHAAMAAQFYDRALLVIESNTLETRDRDRHVDGDQTCFLLNRLRDVYDNLYARQASPEAVAQGIPIRYGFHTNTATKPMVIATLVRVVREGLYVERDPECLDEYLAYERRQNGSYGAIAGHHDDILMTRAIGLHICFHEMDLPRPADTSPYYSARRRPASGDYSTW